MMCGMERARPLPAQGSVRQFPHFARRIRTAAERVLLEEVSVEDRPSS